VLSESWNATRDQLRVQVSGLAGMGYEMNVWNPNQISRAEGATLTKLGKLQIQMPAGPSDSYVEQKVVLNFVP
jgi:hypothetical protein